MIEPTTPSAPSASEPSAATRRPPRWWPAWLILILSGLALVGIWFFREIQRQDRNLQTAAVLLVTVILLLLWSTFLSRFRWRTRLLLLLLVGGPALLLPRLVEIGGVTGDLIPIVRWRWSKRANPASVSNPTPVPATSTTDATPGDADLNPPMGYPQFLGPERNGVLPGPRLARDWNRQPPTEVWRSSVGPGWSGFAVTGHYAITQEQRGAEEEVICRDLRSGSVLWSQADHARYFTTLAGEGPRATPTIAGRRVVSIGATGIMNCLELETGKLLWTKNVLSENGARVPEWGFSGSPLVVGNLVIVSPGGGNQRSLVAYHLSSGESAWAGGDDGAGYSSPSLATLARTQQVLIFNAHSVAAHDPATGKRLWSRPWPGGHPHVSTPLVLPGDRIVISSGYGTGSELWEVKTNSHGALAASKIWKTIRLKAKFTNLVQQRGYIYGLDDGILVCLDVATGEPRWKEGRYGHGQVILVGELLLVMAESGEVVLVDPGPERLRELGRFRALPGKTWNPPALAGDFLLVRNDAEAACYRLPLQP